MLFGLSILLLEGIWGNSLEDPFSVFVSFQILAIAVILNVCLRISMDDYAAEDFDPTQSFWRCFVFSLSFDVDHCRR